MSDKKVVVGRLGSVHGVKGDIKVHSFTNPTKNILAYQPWQIRRSKSQDWQLIEISHSKWHDEQLVVRLKGFEDRELAKQLTNIDIAVDRSQLPKISDESDEHYWTDLMGMKVINVTGVDLGTVDSYFETGANEVMVVKGDQEHLIPYTKDAILKVNSNDRIITVDWDLDDERDHVD